MFEKIFIAVDMAHPEQLPHLVEVAKRVSEDPQQTKYCFIYVDESQIHHAIYPQVDQALYKQARREVKERLRAHAEKLLPDGVSIDCMIRQGTVHEQILEEARQLQPDLILMMARRPGLASYFVGSNSERVVRHAKCSVMILRGAY